ncbi:MAG TPA: MATE family efflux transporter [Thermoanaerobaculia bacterium]|jgi:putative MATE family efflux protein|nr:MATE family efflux transporter [Thermoanaerobaculia bacterium]
MSEEFPDVVTNAAALARPRPWFRFAVIHADPHSGAVTRTVITLALPILVTAALQSASSLGKLYWVGRLGREALAAVAISETIAFMLFPLLIGLSTGTAAIVARHVGSGDHGAAALTAVQSLLLALFLGAGSTILGRIFSPALLSLMGAEPHVVRGGQAYLAILFLGAIPLYVMFIASAALNAAGHTVEPMIASLVMSSVILLLAPCLMFGKAFFPAMGLSGSAWATVLGNITGALLCVGMLLTHQDTFRFRGHQWRPDFRIIGRVIRIGAAGFGQLFLRILAGAAMMRVVAAGGTSAVVAYGIGLRLDSLILTPSFALGGAAATMVGISLGAGNPRRARAAAWSAALSDIAIIVPVTVLTIVFAPLVIAQFNGDASVVRMASSYLRIVWPTHVFTAICIVLGRAAQGAGDTSSSMVVTIIGLWLFQIPVAWFISTFMHPAYYGLWWTVAAAAILQGVLMTIWFEGGRWKRKTL